MLFVFQKLHSLGHFFDLKSYLQHERQIKVIIEPNTIVTIQARDTHAIESIELILGNGAILFFVSDCSCKHVSIHCSADSTVYYMQVIGSSIAAGAQKLIVRMQESNARVSVRMFPLLKAEQKFECTTEQQHDSSSTSTDLRIIGHVGDNAQFGHKGMITVKSGLNDLQIVQRTVMFLTGEQAKAWAMPSF